MKGLYVIKTSKTLGHLVQVIQWSSFMGLVVYEADSRSAIKKVQPTAFGVYQIAGKTFHLFKMPSDKKTPQLLS